MSILQWALLILGIVVVVAIVVLSRRERGGGQGRWTPPAVTPTPTTRPRAMPGADQMDIFGATGQFDEFGVGRPRKRSSHAAENRAGASSDLFADTTPTDKGVPAFVKTRKPPSVDSEPEPVAAPAPVVMAPVAPPPPREPEPQVAEEDTLIVLFVAERDAVAIDGRRIHAALQAQGLEYGAKKIYHRMRDGMVQFSVASIIKPGELDPADAEHFSSPGLTAFMALPGPVKPIEALEDLLRICDRLAGALNAEVYDAHKALLTDEARAGLRERVARWARERKLA